MVHANTESGSSLDVEVGHTLFIDIVGWSLLAMEDQTAAVQRLTSAVRETPEFQEALARSQVLYGPTGDGMFLVFLRSPEIPVRCAVSLTRILHRYPDLRIRMGAHTGPVYRLQNIVELEDVAGGGVSMAARVMDCGDAGHILLSGSIADMLFQLGVWRPRLHDLGEHEVKHGVRLRIFNLYFEDIGREDLPAKLAQQALLRSDGMHKSSDHSVSPHSLSIASEEDHLRHNLPAQLTEFVGREREVTEWLALLRQPGHRLFTITGFGGMGKTRTALRLGALSLNEFEDGVWWNDLDHSFTAEDMVRRIAERLALPIESAQDVKTQLFSFLKGKRALLILDNLEQVAGASTLVCELLNAAQEVKCLVTSRKVLDVRGETALELSPMPTQEATRLFADRAIERRFDFELTGENRPDVELICDRLEGIPLAIELAAARIAAMAPRQILQRLSERFRLLQSRSPNLSPRQSALRSAIDWSYALLTGDDKAVFAQLAAFVGGFTLSEAEAICDAEDVFECIVALRQQSLFRAEANSTQLEQRFAMLESVREYAEEKLAEFDDQGAAIRLRHARYFREFALERLKELRSPLEADALNALKICGGNLDAARRWACEAGEFVLHIELALAEGIALDRRGFLQSAAETLQEGLDSAMPRREEVPALAARLLLERAGVHLDYAEPEDANCLAEEALALFTQTHDIQGMARAENLLGRSARDKRDYESAEGHFDRSLALMQEAGDTIGIAIVRNNQGILRRYDETGTAEEKAKRNRDGVAYLEEALALRRALQDRRGLAETLTNLGVLAFDGNDYDSAWAYYTEAISYERALHHTSGIAILLANLAEVAGLRGQREHSLRLLAASERSLAEAGDPSSGPVAAWLAALAREASIPAELLEQHRMELKSWSLGQCIDWALAYPQPVYQPPATNH